MKRFVPILLFGAVAFLGGYATSSLTKVSAQTQPTTDQPLHPVVQGQGLYFSSEDVKKISQGLPKDRGAGTTLAGTPQYRLSILVRQYFDPPKMTNTSQIMSHWGDGEMHEDHTQLYMILDGTGTLVVGGKAAREKVSTPGQHSGGPVEGGTEYKVKPGDWILIPPHAWHQALPDPGGLRYGMVDIYTRTNLDN